MNSLALAHLTPKRILVVTLADLGDALLTTPALQALRQSFPSAWITVLTSPVGAAALRDQPHDELVIFEKHRFDNPRTLFQPANLRYAARLWRQLRGRQFDSCILLHHLTTWFGTLKYAALVAASGARRRYGLDNGRGFFLTDRVANQGFGARHQADYWLAVVGLLGAQAEPIPPRFVVTESDQRAAAALLGGEQVTERSTQPLIGLHPGSGAFAPARRWPPQRFAALADTLIEEGAQIVLVGGAEEADLRRRVLNEMRHADSVIDLGGRTTLGSLAASLQRCTLFIGNDSGVTHLASSVGTPVVGIFGPTDPRAWGPYAGEARQPQGSFANGVDILADGHHRTLRASIACSPCIYRGHHLGTPNGCPDRTCLQRITVEQVLAVVRQQRTSTTGQVCDSTTL